MLKPDLYGEFKSYFRVRLEETARWPAFDFLAMKLLERNSPLIICETGGLRDPGNWDGDGNSTRIWDFLAEKTGGQLFSIDINPVCKENSTALCSPNTAALTMDSRDFLLHACDAHYWDLLYLDSLDFDGSMNSALHHVCELALVYDRLKSGCLIAVDDCHNENQGKHILVNEFFRRSGIPPLFIGMISVWQKP